MDWLLFELCVWSQMAPLLAASVPSAFTFHCRNVLSILKTQGRWNASCHWLTWITVLAANSSKSDHIPSCPKCLALESHFNDTEWGTSAHKWFLYLLGQERTTSMSRLVMLALWLTSLYLIPQSPNSTYNHSSQKILLPTYRTRFGDMFITGEEHLLPVLLRVLPRSPLIFSLPGRRTDFLGWGTWVSSIIFIWTGQYKMVLNQSPSSQQTDFLSYNLHWPFHAHQKEALKKKKITKLQTKLYRSKVPS